MADEQQPLTPDYLNEQGQNVDEARIALGDAARHTARAPCPDCGITDAVLQVRGGQNTVRCARCRRHLYNEPKTATGQAPRTVATLRADIKPGQQARILERDLGCCVFCHTEQNLTIGHLLSLRDGERFDLTARELNDDANLAVMCEACNLGLSRNSVTLRFYVKMVMYRLLQAELRRQLDTAESSLPRHN